MFIPNPLTVFDIRAGSKGGVCGGWGQALKGGPIKKQISYNGAEPQWGPGATPLEALEF